MSICLELEVQIELLKNEEPLKVASSETQVQLSPLKPRHAKVIEPSPAKSCQSEKRRESTPMKPESTQVKPESTPAKRQKSTPVKPLPEQFKPQLNQCEATSNDQLISEFKKFSISYQECREKGLRKECLSWMILCLVIAILFFYRGEKILNSTCRTI